MPIVIIHSALYICGRRLFISCVKSVPVVVVATTIDQWKIHRTEINDRLLSIVRWSEGEEITNGMRIEEKFGIISSAMDEIERILLKKRKKKEPLRYVFYFLPPLCWNGGSCQRSVHLSNYRSLGASQLGSTMSIKREIRYNCSTFATVYALQSSTFLNRMAVCFTHEML